jgi:hypothetical protein
MKQAIKKILAPKKVQLSDVASPKPSKAATRVLNGALKKAYQDQRAISRRAAVLRGN